MVSLITGGTGFIGSHLMETLLSRGEEVRLLVRKTSDLSFVKEFNPEIVYGDISDKDSVKKAVNGVDTIYHLAFIDLQNSSPEIYMETNADAVKNILDSCIDADVKKILITSSIAAVGMHRPLPRIDETYPSTPEDTYGKTKLEIERLSLKYFQEFGIPITIVRPSIIYGPRQITSFNRVFTAIKSGRFAFIGNGENKWPVSYVKNTVGGMILAAKSKRSSGEVYFLSDEKSYMLKDIVEIIAKEEGVKPPKITIPKWFANSAATVFEAVNKLTKIKVPLKKSTIKFLTMDMEFDIGKAKKDLGYEPRIGLEEGMEKTVKWLKEQRVV